MTKPQSQSFTAWDIYGTSDFAIKAAPIARDWMDQTSQRFAYRCLPLVMANQSGWTIHCPFGLTARWNGTDDVRGIRLWFHDRKKDDRVCSHFGSGVLTFAVPFLFQTPPDVNLWVKGPANMLKDGIQPLEGIIESDWTETSFTMNWKFTRPDTAVRFEKGDPFCMIVPVPRNLAESLTPEIQPLNADPERRQRFERWKASRTAFNEALAAKDPDTSRQGWQRTYMQGRDIDGQVHSEHQTRLALKPFRRKDGD
ncbi:MAG: DUF6065 family protein [Fuerstiella sp.]